MSQVVVPRIEPVAMSLEAQKHPLDPLTSEEIIQVSALLKTQGAGKEHGLHFKAIGIIEPPKSKLRAFLSAERNGPKPNHLLRRASALFYHRGTSDLFLAEIDLCLNVIDKIDKLASRIHAQADIDEAILMRDLCLQHPTVLEAIKKFKIPEDLTVVCDTWPYGRDHGEEFPRSVQVKFFLLQL
jgi:primary-amine oxidase